jgi:hypothetical protein
MQVNGIETSFQEETRNVCPFVISTEYQLITKFCYASLIYSKAFLSEKVGLQSPLQSNYYFLRREARMSDSSLVGIRYAHEECSVPLTESPQHIIYLVQFETVLSKVKDLEEKQHSNVDLIVE